MCFSADASLATGILLLPAGAYCVTAALQKNTTFLPLATTPILFGVQQICEAGVWIGLGYDDPDLVKVASLAFLFFAIAFWPFWLPVAAATSELRPERKRLFIALAGVGLVLGSACYIPAAIHYDEWLTVGIAGHSIQYDLSRVPMAEAVAGVVWQGVYLALICVPLLMSREPRLRTLGISVAVSALITHVVFRYAFASVWCFFAAILSAHICRILYWIPIVGGPALPTPRWRPETVS